VDQPPVLAFANGVELLDALAPSNRAQNVVLLGGPVGRDQLQNRAANDFVRRIAEDAFGAHIPRRDEAVEVFADDGVVGRFDDRGEPSCGIQAGIVHSHVEC
jgi:hypothetical protein